MLSQNLAQLINEFQISAIRHPSQDSFISSNTSLMFPEDFDSSLSEEETRNLDIQQQQSRKDEILQKDYRDDAYEVYSSVSCSRCFCSGSAFAQRILDSPFCVP